VVERQQLVDQREGNAWLGCHVQTIKLQPHVGSVVAGLEDLVLFLEIEQGA
jgi:hypothetical protein